MVWRLRASLQDRPGSLVKLTTACGADQVNILALDVQPTPDGKVTDEFVLHAPDGWTEEDVRDLCRRADILEVDIKQSSVHALEDVPVRYLRAVTELLSRPGDIEEQLTGLLCGLLDAEPDDCSGRHEPLSLDDGPGPSVRLARRHPFTDTEWARAAELRRIAVTLQATLGSQGTPTPPAVGSDRLTAVSLRRGSLADIEAVQSMHARCSADTLRRRYHAAFGALTPRVGRAVLAPERGFSLLLSAEERGRDCVIAMGLVVVHGDVAEAAILVEDRWQRHGFGGRVLGHLAAEAASSGIDELTLLAQPDNQTAVARTIASAGLSCRRDLVDGLIRFRIPVQPVPTRPGHRGQPAMGSVTVPLATLLHRRSELRDAVIAADLIDASIRDGA